MSDPITILHQEITALRRENKEDHNHIFKKLDRNQGCLSELEKGVLTNSTHIKYIENWFTGKKTALIFTVLLFVGAIGGMIGAKGITPIFNFVIRQIFKF